ALITLVSNRQKRDFAGFQNQSTAPIVKENWLAF
ncbi:hypothetical protein CISIN_1g0485411mg, partial [Citrus sinensis]